MASEPAKILLLEDNPEDRRFMATCIDGHGKAAVDVKQATRLADARDRLERQDFELIITDLNLPDADGLDTYFKVRELAPNAAIVVMTGMDDSELAARAVREGAQDYLVKGDMSPEKIWRSVSNALQRSVQVRRLAGVARTLRRENEGLKEQARIDPLTGLLNRQGLQRALKRLHPRDKRSACALLLDVDGFKKINHMLGYVQGDRALRRVGSAIRENLRPDDSAGRLDGDSFLVLLAPATGAKGLEVAERMRLGVAGENVPSFGGDFKVTVSVGVVPIAPGSEDIDSLLALAHGALRQSKEAGKNKVSVVEPVEAPEAAEPALIRRPFFKLSDSSLAGCEFSPVELPGPAQTGAEWGAPAHLRRQLAAAAKTQGLECHLQLSHAELFRLRPEDLAEALPPGLDRRRLRLSITEVPMSPLPPGLVGSVRRLQKEGWLFAVRELTLETHNWANLILLEPAVVTLHPDLVAGVEGDTGRLRALVRLLRAVAALGAYVVAEGVDSLEEVGILASLGVPYARGGVWKADSPFN